MIRLVPIAVLLAGCNYEPPVRDTDDRMYRPPPNVIQGTISLIGPEEPATTYVLLFDNEKPGPPEGTDAPLDFATVSAQEYSWAGSIETLVPDDTGFVPGELDLGWHAPWAAVELPDAAYQVEAIVDVDGDFSGGIFTLGGATCGDWQGAYRRMPGDTAKGAVAVEGGQLLEGVSVTVSQRLDTERPAFAFPDADGFRRLSLQAIGNAAPVGLTYTLESTGVHVQYDEDGEQLLDFEDACTPDPANATVCVADTECQTAFSLYYPDADGNGLMDPHPDFGAYGLKDAWPRVFLQFRGTVELDAENKPVRDPETGLPVTTPLELPPEDEGVFWATENFTYGDLGAFGLSAVPVGTPAKVPEISVLFPPLVAKFYPEGHAHCAGAPGGCSDVFDLSNSDQRAQVPRGVWDVNIISWTGQTWAVPNEIPELAVSTDPNFDVQTQAGFVLTVD